MQYTNIKIIYFLKPVANIYRHHYRTEVLTGMKDDYFTILFAKLVESGQLDSETAKKLLQQILKILNEENETPDKR